MQILDYCKSKGIVLYKKGHEFRGLCPLHHETVGSFNVDPEQGLWYCFGCGKGGSLPNLIMELEQVSLHEALSRAGNPTSNTVLPVVAKPDPLTLEVRQRLATVAIEYNRSIAIPAQVYLEERGITPLTITRYYIGWCPESSISTPPFGNGNYPYMANRITFPCMIRDNTECLYIQGRGLHGANPKYIGLALPKPLYGFHRLRHKDRVYLVEGPFDWLTLLQWGATTVASLGANLSPMQIALLMNRDTILCQDNDLAGEAAAAHLASVLPRAIRVAPPEGVKDWNEWLVKGATKTMFLEYMSQKLTPAVM